MTDRPYPALPVPRRAFLAAATFAAPVLLASPASAHDLLRRSVPPPGGVVPPGPLAFTLEFSGRIDRGLSELVLVSPGEEARTLALAPDGPPNVLSAPADVRPGSHVLRWTVMSSDGHLTRGTVAFRAGQGR